MYNCTYVLNNHFHISQTLFHDFNVKLKCSKSPSFIRTIHWTSFHIHVSLSNVTPGSLEGPKVRPAAKELNTTENVPKTSETFKRPGQPWRRDDRAAPTNRVTVVTDVTRVTRDRPPTPRRHRLRIPTANSSLSFIARVSKTRSRIIYIRFRTISAVLLRWIRIQNNEAEIEC